MRPCALRRSPPDLRDWRYGSVTATTAGATGDAAPPPRVDWRASLPPVRDQGQEPTCAAHAGACVKEAQERGDTGVQCRFSPRFLYTLRANRPADGMWLRDLMAILRTNGACSEAACPYEAGAPLDAVPEAARAEAAGFRVAGYALVSTAAEAKAALAAQGPCVLALPVYGDGGDAPDGAFWRPSAPGQAARGGHAVALVGYDDARQAFLLRNSWGAGWNGDGHAWFPYADWGAQWEAWSSVDERGSREPPKPMPDVVEPSKKKRCC